MKKYYSRLTKEKKKDIQKIYKEKYQNSDLHVRLVRLVIFASIGYITATVLLFDAFLNHTTFALDLAIAIILIIISTIFLIGSFKIKLKVLNQIALKNK